MTRKETLVLLNGKLDRVKALVVAIKETDLSPFKRGKIIALSTINNSITGLYSQINFVKNCKDSELKAFIKELKEDGIIC